MKPLRMTNAQPSETPVRDPSGALDVVGVFHTIQGEGPYTGAPAVFVRLAGCNLKCPACDTRYTDGRQLISPAQLIDRIESVRGKATVLIVLTGGEPFRQDISPLTELLLIRGLQVQVETNGTLFIEYFPYRSVSVVCSPKTPKIHPRVMPFVRALKYVLHAGHVDDRDGLPSLSLGMACPPQRPWEGFSGEVFLQPEDSPDPIQLDRNTRACVESCLKFGYRLSVQTHKLLGVP